MDSSNSVGKLDVFKIEVLNVKKRISKIDCLYRGLSVLLLVVLIAGLGCRLLTPFRGNLMCSRNPYSTYMCWTVY